MISVAAVAVFAASLFGDAAYAHPQLQSADPAPGTSTTTSPTQIRIATGKAATDPANKKLLVVPISEQLSPGDYKVEWHAVSDDIHRVKGSFSFSVTRSEE